jgi:hypothetical protein
MPRPAGDAASQRSKPANKAGMKPSFELDALSGPLPPFTRLPRHGQQATRELHMPVYMVRHLEGQIEEVPCLIQLEDENAAMYFNIIHGSKLRRRFTTEALGKPCKDYVLIARDYRTDGSTQERAITLFDLA